MADRSAIEWCDSTFNPWMGCTKVSPGCDHCYAEARLDTRLHVVSWGAGQPRKRTSAANWRYPEKWNEEPFIECGTCNWRGEKREFFQVGPRGGRWTMCPSCAGSDWIPARRRVFCASLADVFDNEVDPEWRRDLFRLIAHTKNLDWLLLTKRIGNAATMLQETAGSFGFDWAANPWDHVWLGATVVNRAEMLRDALKLAATPAAVRFWSVEPMLGDLGAIPLKLMPDWVIVGGESGHHARPMHPDWARSLRDQCAAAGVPFLFKQWGEWRPISDMEDADFNLLYRSRVKAREGQDQGALDESYGRVCTVPDGIIHADGSLHDVLEPMAFQQGTGAMQTFRVGKKAAGRLLDGRTHDGFPDGVSVARPEGSEPSPTDGGTE